MTDFRGRPNASLPGDQRRIYVPPPPSGQPPPPPRTRQPGPSPYPPPPYPPDPATPRRQPTGPPPGLPVRPGGPFGPDGPDELPLEPDDRPLWKRIRWRWVVLALVVIFVLIPLLLLFWAWRIFGGIDRVEVSPVLSSGNGTNYLIVGSDSREGLGEDSMAAADVAGQRADSMMILHFGDDGTKIMSVPRDLWVVNAATGEEGKINGAYNPDAGGGPSSLIETITDNLDIPIDRYMEVDFVSFAGLVDSVGGVTIDFPHPATDSNSGLVVTESGPVQLDGEQALAYVRSRHYTEHIDGRLEEDPTGDLGRVTRQQRFLTAVFSELGSTRNPLTLMRSFESVAEGLRIDDKMSMWDALGLGLRMRGANPEPIELPTDDAGFAETSALVLADGADSVLDQFR